MLKNSFLRKCLFNFVSFATSDYLSQVIENRYLHKKKSKEIKIKRLLKHGLLGVAMTPIYNFQYSILEPALFKPNQYIKRMIFDQIICFPIQNTIFFAVEDALQGKTIQETRKKLKTAIIPSIINGYKVWPAITVLTFKYVPPYLCEYSFSFIGMVWGIYLSYIGHKK